MASDLQWQSSSAPTHGTLGDINTMRVSPDYLGMGQDVLIDTNGVLRSRGAFASITADSFAGLSVVGVGQTQSATGLTIAETGGDILFYATTAAALTGFAKLTVAGYATSGTSQSMTSQAAMFMSTKLPNDGGCLLGGDGAFVIGGTTPSFMWGGNAVTTSETTTGTAASTIGSKAIAGVGTAWTSALVGCYLFIGAGTAANYVGQVAAVGSTTTITLAKGALKTIAAAAPCFKTVRPTLYNTYKGRITTNTASAVVVGSNTKFMTAGPGATGSVFLTASTMNVFRYSDGAFVGAISSVQNDGTLTLGANAAIAMTNEEYFINNPTFTIATQPTTCMAGSGVARYADRYWYGGFINNDPGASSTQFTIFNYNSLAFTKKNEPECLDLDSAAGDILTLPTGQNQDRIRALYPVTGGLLVFRTFDTFLITGYSPETFKAIKILDDGVCMSLCAQPYKQGVVWAGTESVWYFDGTRITNLLKDSVQRFYQRTSSLVPSSNNPTTLGISNDHVFVSYKVNTAGDQTWPYKNTTKTINTVTMVINMLNGAVTFFTNICVTTSFFSTNFNTIVLVTRTNNTLRNCTSFLLNGNTIFLDSAVAADNFDAVTGVATFSSGTQIGPDVMFESTKLTMGDAARLKFWKRLLMNYSSNVGMTATFIGTNDTTLDFPNRGTGTASADVIAASANVGIVHRMRFLVRSATLSMRIYQTSTTSATSQRFKCFWWSVGGKLMRQGRAQP